MDGRSDFSDELAFGTGGLRGRMGPGPNRINAGTIQQATYGLAMYLKAHGLGSRGVVIAYDTRRNSREFACQAGRLLNRLGIKAYMFDGPRPTPELSFAVRHSGADAGIVITASHNPADYNGFKVYRADGVQILPDTATAIRAFMAQRPWMPAEPDRSGMGRSVPLPDPLGREPELIGPGMDQEYLTRVRQYLEPMLYASASCDVPFSVLYTPLHGTGSDLVPQLLDSLGFRVFRVEAQAQHDADFSTADPPNPEEPAVFELAVRMADLCHPDVILATDPDCDRIGIMVKTAAGYQRLTGNQAGVILAGFLLEYRPDTGVTGSDRPVIVKTCVTTDMVYPMAAEWQAEVIETPPGFKYVGHQAEMLTKEGRQFLLGLEESCGYLAGDLARDKDAVLAAGLLAVAGHHTKAGGKTLVDRLDELRHRFGCFGERLVSVAAIASHEWMSRIRHDPPGKIGEHRVEKVRDGLSWAGSVDLLQFVLSGDVRITVRPSGTEPKLKVYIAVHRNNPKMLSQALDSVESGIRDWLALFARPGC